MPSTLRVSDYQEKIGHSAKGMMRRSEAPYIDPTYPVGSIVLIREPTHDFYYETKNVIGIVYEAYVYKGFKMYAVLF